MFDRIIDGMIGGIKDMVNIALKKAQEEFDRIEI